MGRAIGKEQTLEGLQNNRLGLEVQRKQSNKNEDDEEENGLPVYRGACKSERALGEESSKRNTRRHRKTGLETGQGEGNRYPQVCWKNPQVSPNLY